MITENMIYWITRLDDIKDMVFGMGLGLILLMSMGCVIACVETFGGKNKRAAKYIMISTIGAILSLLLLASSAFIPTTKEMCAIKAIPVIVNDEEMQGIPDKVLELATEWIEELRPNNLKSED